MSNQASAVKERGAFAFWKPALFLLVVAVGLWYVKWQPYYGKALLAAQSHSIGDSILTKLDSHPITSAIDYSLRYFKAVWKAAVLGILLGSLIQVLIPRDWLFRLLGRSAARGTLLGTLFALPGMMCTCCAAPVAAGMRKQSVSMTGALAFWLGNPLLNPATLIFMGFILGWQFTLIRLLAGILILLGVGFSVHRWCADELPVGDQLPLQTSDSDTRFWQRWMTSLWHLFWSTIPPYVLAVMLLGAAQSWLFPHAEGVIGNTLGWMLAMAVAGCLFVIPTAAEIPITQTLMTAGMGMGPALALLITLPALSLPSLMMLRQAFPTRALWLTTAVVLLVGMLAGAGGLLLG
jgi:uncharacterized protein